MVTLLIFYYKLYPLIVRMHILKKETEIKSLNYTKNFVILIKFFHFMMLRF